MKDHLPKVTQEEIDNVNRPVSIEEIESTINNFLKQKAPGPDQFTGEFYQIFKEKLNNSLQSLPVDRNRWDTSCLLLQSQHFPDTKPDRDTTDQNHS